MTKIRKYVKHVFTSMEKTAAQVKDCKRTWNDTFHTRRTPAVKCRQICANVRSTIDQFAPTFFIPYSRCSAQCACMYSFYDSTCRSSANMWLSFHRPQISAGPRRQPLFSVILFRCIYLSIYLCLSAEFSPLQTAGQPPDVW